MQRLDEAVEGLEQALSDCPSATPSWRGLVNQRLGSVVEELTAESADDAVDETWLNSRGETLHRERDRLLTRLGALSAMIAESSDVEPLRQNLLRLVHDVHRHHARVNDLCYDSLALDVGGSE